MRVKTSFRSLTPMLATAGVLLLATTAGAEQPRAAIWEILEASPSGIFDPGPNPAGDVQVLIGLHPGGDRGQAPLLVLFPGCGEDPKNPNRPVLNLEDVLQRGAEPRFADWEDPGPRWRMCPDQDAVLLFPGAAGQVQLALDFLGPFSGGISPVLRGEVHELSDEDLRKVVDPQDPRELARLVGDRAPGALLEVDVHYLVDGEKAAYRRGDWHGVYGKPAPDPLEAPATGDYAVVADRLAVDVTSFRADLPIPKETVDDGGARFRRSLEYVELLGSGLAGDKVCFREDVRVVTPDKRKKDAAQLFQAYYLSGRFSTKWTSDHSLHPGWGFRVEAWTDDFGFWHVIASDWVQSNGTWSLYVPSSELFVGNHLRIYYRLHTSYYDVKDLSDNRYAWRDPDQFNIPTYFDAGHRYADTDGGAFSGIGEVADAAMWTWSRLYWNGGINPVPASPINLYVPNTTYDCGDGSGSPWSCASVSGNIWLISAHATQARVVSHELGHQLNYKYWAYKRPANAGGSHSASSCYPTRTGMTLFEGFAGFVAGWVGYPGRNVADGGFGSGRWSLGGMDLEQRTSPPSCSNGWENETWVARAFWDLHDTQGDGQDILWFVHPGGVPAIYLNNGVANDGDARDMRFYETPYRNAASSGHEGFISDIFDQNRH